MKVFDIEAAIGILDYILEDHKIEAATTNCLHDAIGYLRKQKELCLQETNSREILKVVKYSVMYDMKKERLLPFIDGYLTLTKED